MYLFRLLLGISLLMGVSACSMVTTPSHKAPACQGSVVRGCSPTVYFLFDSDAISLNGKKRLDWAIKKLTRYPNKRVILSAYTDQIGTQKYNMSLSRRRAESTKKYLISKDINADRIAVKVYGMDHPACRDAHRCAYLNRRVVLTIK